ncbi:MAG: glycosyltransferase [Candidatus Eisenbacteria bacterium]|uniref:Glycosyltransferase n=1 Tax=Eiseniibacteriota bacterium TaxID=2212470 RepID=A0A538SIW8_UNCEI|nr:MAG: glycosyltransferase [Candidatus Eisenbacteria bacterium]
MSQRRALLIELLDAAGADLPDARARARALHGAGLAVRGVAIGLHPPPGARVSPGPSVVECASPAEGRKWVRDTLARFHPEVVIVASTARGGGAAASWIPRGVPAWWWPTGLRSSSRKEARLPWPRARRLPLLGGGHAGRSSVESDSSAALEWSVIEGAKRRLLALWDGDYVLFPTALSGRSAAEALRAFATVARDRDGLDGVVLAHPQPEFMRLRRQLGIGTRLHFVGAAPREAEYAWLGAAAATVLAGDAPISAGLVLRALACGSPVLPIGSRGHAARVRAWLEKQHGRALPAGEGHARPAAELEWWVARGAAVGEAIGRGRALAARHEPEALAARLADALGARPATAREAA